MAIVRYTAGKELTPEKEAEMRARIRAAAKRPYTYDPDSPLLTEEQLSEFRPVHFSTEEERRASLREAGIINPDLTDSDPIATHAPAMATV